MKQVIQSNRYDFIIVADERVFYIRAIDKKTTRCSCINNLNPVLSELGVNPEESRFGDSSWGDLSDKEVNNFFGTSVQFLSDEKFRNYIENKLDEDRYCGEWENFASQFI